LAIIEFCKNSIENFFFKCTEKFHWAQWDQISHNKIARKVILPLGYFLASFLCKTAKATFENVGLLFISTSGGHKQLQFHIP